MNQTIQLVANGYAFLCPNCGQVNLVDYAHCEVSCERCETIYTVPVDHIYHAGLFTEPLNEAYS